MVTAMLFALTLYVTLWIFFKILAWADTAPPKVHPVPGLCGCAIDPVAGVYGHCSHKKARIPEYVPRHAAV